MRFGTWVVWGLGLIGLWGIGAEEYPKPYSSPCVEREGVFEFTERPAVKNLSNDKYEMIKACRALRYSAGNFYINDKPTGAVVGQQPFGGGRASGTNDKAGSAMNLMRWMTARTIKETFDPPKDWRYPFMSEK